MLFIDVISRSCVYTAVPLWDHNEQNVHTFLQFYTVGSWTYSALEQFWHTRKAQV